jgi:hypothetical protein
MAERLWPRAIAWLAGCGALFYVSYPTANWLASLRAHVPVVCSTGSARSRSCRGRSCLLDHQPVLRACRFFLCRDRSELEATAGGW